MRCEYGGELADFIERTNCLKGCTHATLEYAGQADQFVTCDIGLLAQLFVTGSVIPEFEAHGNRYVVCLSREAPPREPFHQDGPDLFGEDNATA